MRSVLSFFSMLALGLMIAAVFMVAPSGNGTITNIGGFEFGESDARLPFGCRRARHRPASSRCSGRSRGKRGAPLGRLDRQPGTSPVARRLGGVFVAVLFTSEPAHEMQRPGIAPGPCRHRPMPADQTE